jgi:hypothetical protein
VRLPGEMPVTNGAVMSLCTLPLAVPESVVILSRAVVGML